MSSTESYARPNNARFPLLSVSPNFLRTYLDETVSFQPSIEEFLQYGQPAGDQDLRAALAKIVDADSEQLIITDGASQALLLLLATIIRPGDRVLLPSPGFPAYRKVIEYFGGKPCSYMIGQSPELIAKEIINLLGLRPRMVILNSPNNPTGADLSELFDLISPLCGCNDCFIVSDESYSWMEDAHGGMSRLDSRLRQAPSAAIYSVGKYLCMPGLRVGCLLTNSNSLVASLIDAKRHLAHSTMRSTESFALTSLNHFEVNRTGMIEELAKRRSEFHHCTRRLGVEFAAGNAGFFVYARRASRLDELSVAGVPGDLFGDTLYGRRYCLAASSADWTALMSHLTNHGA